MDQSRADLALTARAARERWPLDAETVAFAMREVLGVMTSKDVTPRLTLSSARVLVAMDRANTEAAKLDREARDERDLDARIALAEARARDRSAASHQVGEAGPSP